MPDNGILRVQILGFASDAADRALHPLIEELNATATIYPGTELTLVRNRRRSGTAMFHHEFI